MKRYCKFGNEVAAMLLAAAASAGCPPTSHPVPIEDINCHYTFTGLENPSERERVSAAIKKYAKDGVLTSEPDPASGSPEYGFVVHHFETLDKLQAELVYGNSDGQPRLNIGTPNFSIRYDAANLGATIDTIVHFRATPGAELHYQEGPDKERVVIVPDSGNVELPVNISAGQQFIYARIKVGTLEKSIRINLYTHQTESISPGAH